MASLLELNANSSKSEDDCDYVPEKCGKESKVSENEEEFSDEDIPRECKTQKRSKHDNTKAVATVHDPYKLSPTEVQKRAEEVWNNFIKYLEENKAEEILKKSAEEAEAKKLAEEAEAKKLAEEAEAKKLAKEAEAKKFAEEAETVKSCDSPSGNVGGKMTVAESDDFAGETITKEVGNDDKRALKSAQNTSCFNSEEGSRDDQPSCFGNKRHASFESIFANLANKKGKMTTQRKSFVGWNSFQKGEPRKEELEEYNKGKGGFLEKKSIFGKKRSTWI